MPPPPPPAMAELHAAHPHAAHAHAHHHAHQHNPLAQPPQDDDCCGAGGVAINQRTGQPIRVACLPCHRARTSCDRDALAAKAGDGSRPPCSRCVRLNRQSRCVDRPPRKTTKVACVHCVRAKRSCGEQRPCRRCVSRGMAEQCMDREEEARRARKAAETPVGTLGAVPPPLAALPKGVVRQQLQPRAVPQPRVLAQYQHQQHQQPVFPTLPAPVPAAAAAPAPAPARPKRVSAEMDMPAPVPTAAAATVGRMPERRAVGPAQHRPKRQRLLSFEGPPAIAGSMDLSLTPMLSFPTLHPSQVAPGPAAAAGSGTVFYAATPAPGRARSSSMSSVPASAMAAAAAAASVVKGEELPPMPLFVEDGAEDVGVPLDLPVPPLMRLDSSERALSSGSDGGSSIQEELDDWVAMFGADPFDVQAPVSPASEDASTAPFPTTPTAGGHP